VPVVANYLEDPRCDVLPSQALTHELGDLALFPLNESIFVQAVPTQVHICAPNDLIANDWQVDIVNTSGIAWQNLFFVGNLGMTIGNADGNMIDVVNAPGVVTDAFRIDGTVTGGLNNNLVFESLNVNEIFEPGERWTFYVTNFMDNQGLTPPPFLRTPGLFAGSAPLNAALPDTASIVATPVPEPTTLLALSLVVGTFMLRRSRSALA
jgi:hypothetical protein